MPTATKAIPSEGATLTKGGTAIGQVLSITPPKPSRAAVDTTHLGSTVKTARPGRIPTPGELTFRVLATVGHAAIADLLTDYTVQTWAVAYTAGTGGDAGSETFDGFLIEEGTQEINDEGNIEIEFTVHANTLPVRTLTAVS